MESKMEKGFMDQIDFLTIIKDILRNWWVILILSVSVSLFANVWVRYNWQPQYTTCLLYTSYHSPTVDKSIAEISLPAQAVLIAIYEEDTMIIPHGETVIRAGQYILAFADEAAMKELNRIFGSGESV